MTKSRVRTKKAYHAESDEEEYFNPSFKVYSLGEPMNPLAQSHNTRRHSRSTSKSKSTSKTMSNTPYASTSAADSKLFQAFANLFRTLRQTITQVTKITYRTLIATVRVTCRVIIATLRFLCAPIVIAGALVRTSTQFVLRYLRLVLMGVFATWIFVFSWTDGALLAWARDSTHTTKSNNDSDNNHTPNMDKFNVPLTTLKRAQHVNRIIKEHLVGPLKTFLLFGIPQLTYEMLRVWHLILLHGGTRLFDFLLNGVRDGMALLYRSGAGTLLERWGFTPDNKSTPPDHSNVASAFRNQFEQKLTDDEEDRMLRGYFKAWDSLEYYISGTRTTKIPRKPYKTTTPYDLDKTVDKTTSSTRQSSHDGDGIIIPTTIHESPRMSSSSTEVLPATDMSEYDSGLRNVWKIIAANDTRKLTIKQGFVQLSRPWKAITSVLSSRIPFTHITRKNVPSKMVLSHARDALAPSSRYVKKVTAYARQKAHSVSNKALTEETRRAIADTYKKNMKKLMADSVDEHRDGSAWTVCALMQGYFSAISTHEFTTKAASTLLTRTPNRALWKAVPQETVRLTFLDYGM